MFKRVRLLLRLMLGWAVFFISGYVKRDPNTWVFGSFNGFDDNPKYLYLYMLQKHPEIRVIWISKDKNSVKKAKESGGEAYSLNSFKGIYYALIAQIYIYNGYVSDICFFTSRNARLVNLWHGIPIKKIEFDISSKPLVDHFNNARWIEKFVYAHKHVKADLVLCPSLYVADYSFKSAFRLDDSRCLYAQYPRVTALLAECEYDKLYNDYSKVFLYAPTWRDSGVDFITSSGIDFDILNKLLFDNNSLLYIKLHPLTNFSLNKKYSNIKMAAQGVELNAMLRSSDCLITDYSSIVFDYLRLNRPVIFFNYDLDEFQKNRELYFSYDDIICGEVATDFRSLIIAMKSVIANNDDFSELRNKIANKFLDQLNENDFIIEKLKQF